jgi:hypothetical protein
VGREMASHGELELAGANGVAERGKQREVARAGSGVAFIG